MKNKFLIVNVFINLFFITNALYAMVLTASDYDEILHDLGRVKHQTNDHELENFLDKKVVLVTGGVGSIGSEIIRQACKYSPDKIIAFDQSEYGVFAAKENIKNDCGNIPVIYKIGSILDYDYLNYLLQVYKVDIIYHAAAYKHVPLMEEQPYQAVKNNIGGTLNLLRASREQQIKTFVNISTDKAVNPSCVMGATKRINEILVRQFAKESPNNYLSVRFGNVFGSSGSVGPIFEQQILASKPITITHPEMTRYMMSIPEAAKLVLLASSLSKTQDGIFLLDMGTPIRIMDLATAMIRKLHAKPDTFPIQFTGIRPGEKLHEILSTSEEELISTELNPQILMVKDCEIVSNIFEKVEQLINVNPTTNPLMIKSLLQSVVKDFFVTFCPVENE
jgi:FlaA1/EpsC-like NDP-sugar epimerase